MAYSSSEVVARAARVFHEPTVKVVELLKSKVYDLFFIVKSAYSAQLKEILGCESIKRGVSRPT